MKFDRLAAFIRGDRKTFGDVNAAVSRATTERLSPVDSKTKTPKSDHLDEIEVIPEYLEVKEALRRSVKLIFVTGGAGTGKSTFIRWLDSEFRGKTLLCAPTGIAAITIAGKTIHSLCRFPPSWIVETDIKIHPKSLASHAEILVIDEVSMVNANILDAIDKFFKINRRSDKPFGGIAVVMVGDLFQLPPIVTKTTRHLFDSIYESPKFFSARAIASSEFYSVELKKAFRQVDQNFVNLLQNVREGNDISKTLEILNSSCKVMMDPEPGTIALSPRHIDVDRINSGRLAGLPGKAVAFTGTTTGQFNEKQLPVPKHIELKVGAQVVLAKNSKSYVNGDIGIVRQIRRDRIEVMLTRRQETVEVPIATWEQFDYRFNSDSKEIERVVVGTFVQLPVILAWAMTIHKSQGLTLERVHIDMGAGSFETGQTYVALSRCRSMATLSLAKHLKAEDVKVDPKSKAFYAEIRQ